MTIFDKAKVRQNRGNEVDWSQVSQIVLAVFAIVLAGATIGLVWTTRQYTKATKKMARTMRLDFVDRLYWHIVDRNTGNKYARALVNVEEGRDISGFTEAEKEEWDKLCEKTRRAYRILTKELLDDVNEELPQGD